MDKRIRYIENEISKPGKINLTDDNDLFITIGENITGLLDIDDVQDDMALQSTREMVKDMVSEYNKKSKVNSENERFVRDGFSNAMSEKILSDEIKSIKKEIANNHLNEVTAEWVREWHERKQKSFTNRHSEEIQNFISGSINSDRPEPAKPKRYIIRYTSLAAAAVLGVFILIRSLQPSSNHDKLFNSYYSPYAAISSVTRGTGSENERYSTAVESYKAGDYNKAAAGFAAILEKSPASVSALYFLGLSQLSLENYEQAENCFTGAIGKSGEYTKEARWYLGLTYLKTGNKQKAVECFKILASSQGYYRERSEEILRRLK